MALRGFFIDSNLLVLLVVGQTQPSLIGRHRRVKGFTRNDYDRLLDYVGRDTKIFVTPNTLTETSNLLGFGTDELRSRLFETLKTMIDESNEVYICSTKASDNPEFGWIGLTDAALLESVSVDTPLLTVDFMLYLAVLEREPNAVVNFNHL